MAEEKIRTILTPTDFSEGAARALGWARTLAQACGAKIVLLHVVDLAAAWMPVGGLGSIPAPVPPDVIEQFTKAAQAALDAMAGGASEVTQRLLRNGHPREVILEVANAVRADVIVMGTHGRRGFSHLFIGSVAEHIVRHAPVPVLTVRTPEP
jgi:nucleotide-binding universal stress UspA family protein